jgi:hypothetical protein
LDCCAERFDAVRKQIAATRYRFVKVFTRLLFFELNFAIRESNGDWRIPAN